MTMAKKLQHGVTLALLFFSKLRARRPTSLVLEKEHEGVGYLFTIKRCARVANHPSTRTREEKR